ncbi:hypothetical protein NQ109_19170 [Priestia megaterium]|uniref:hypothetical protein n=1 Tax=Priestia TaxID=2800373 RepID=UPI00215A74AE|nr:hypothetical protein [Priestia megaterium]MCR8865052.1 hypothetical protein [Priestia megaterium]
MAKKNLKFDFKIDESIKEALSPEKLKEARRNAVTAAGMAWADETKEIVREDDHIDTSLYINSIGYLTDIPAQDKTGKGSRAATQNDVVHELIEGADTTILLTGSGVSYAEILEKRYNIMARGLDRASERMDRVAQVQIQKTLDL